MQYDWLDDEALAICGYSDVSSPDTRLKPGNLALVDALTGRVLAERQIEIPVLPGEWGFNKTLREAAGKRLQRAADSTESSAAPESTGVRLR